MNSYCASRAARVALMLLALLVLLACWSGALYAQGAGKASIIWGIVALVRDQVFVVSGRNVISLDYTAWGWIHLILGVVAVVAGLGVLAGRLWGRIIGIALAVISAVVNMAFLAAYPIWSIVVITFDVIVIYALAVHGKEVRTLTE